MPLAKEQHAAAAAKIKAYLEETFEIDASHLQAELFVRFLSEQIGLYYYNKGVTDALSMMHDKLDDLYLLIKDEP